MGHNPATLRAAAAVQAAESAVLLVATVLVGIDTAAGRSYQQSSGIALTLIGVASVAALATVAAGLAQARRWSRTPALLTQLFFGIVGIYLLQGQRLDWGVTSVVLAAAGFATLLAPPSLRALTGQRTRPDQEQARADQEQRQAGQQQKQAGQQRKPASQQGKQAGQQRKPAAQQRKQAGQQQKRTGQQKPPSQRKPASHQQSGRSPAAAAGRALGRPGGWLRVFGLLLPVRGHRKGLSRRR